MFAYLVEGFKTKYLILFTVNGFQSSCLVVKQRVPLSKEKVHLNVNFKMAWKLLPQIFFPRRQPTVEDHLVIDSYKKKTNVQVVCLLCISTTSTTRRFLLFFGLGSN